MWIDKLKIALIEKDVDGIDKLLENIPELTDPKELETAILLLKQASELLHILKDETATAMLKTKQNLDYLNVTKEGKSSKLDIKS